MSNTLHEIIDGFRRAMADAGIEYHGDLIADGTLHRFTPDGDRAGSDNGWYVLYGTPPGGGKFGSWKLNIEHTYTHRSDTPLTPEQRDAMRRQAEESKRKRDSEKQERHANARAIAESMWQSAASATSHPYTDRKGITPKFARIGTWPEYPGYDVLLIPAFSGQTLHTLQGIFPDGTKRFLPGGAIKGNYCKLQSDTDTKSTVIICEGYATGVSIHTATGYTTVVAFFASNLLPVAEKIRKFLPDASIIIAADNDQWTDGNPGVTEANRAAAAINARVVTPAFIDLKPDERPTDFNDMHAMYGAYSLREAFGITPQIMPKTVNITPSPPDMMETLMDSSQVSQQPQESEQPIDPGYFGTPVDVFGTKQPPSIPYDVMPPEIAAYVRDQSELLGCDPSILAIGAIVSAASCIHDGIRLYPKRSDHTWFESARLWGAIVGSPSTRKSPALSKAMRHVKRIDHQMAEDNQKAAAEYKHQLAEYKDAVKLNQSLPEPKPPISERILVEDTTVEAMSEILKDNPRGILCYQDELTGWFASMDAYKASSKGANKDRAHWLQAYNGGRHTVDRVTRGNLIIPNWSACVLGGIQPDVMRGLASGMGNDGLLQRFIVVVANPACEDVDRTPDMDAINGYKLLFDNLIQIQPTEDRVRLSDQAHESRIRVSKYALRMVNAFMGSPLEAWLGKWDGLYSRLLLTYHVIECAANAVHPANRPVSGDTAIRVEQLLCGSLIHHAVYFYNEIVDTHSRQENIRQLARLILARGFTSISKRDLSNSWKASRKLEWHQMRDVTQNLCNMDWLAPDYNKLDTDGRPRSWVVNPQVHELFKDHAEREIERRKEVIQTLKELRDNYRM